MLLIMKKEIDSTDVAARLKRLANAGIKVEQAMRNFSRVARLMQVNLPTVNDWRKYTMRNKRYE